MTAGTCGVIQRKLLLVITKIMVALAGTACLVAVAGCSGSDQRADCGFGERGEYVRLHNSELTCEEAVAMLNVLPDIKRPQNAGAPSDPWICVYLPSDRLPIRIQCHQGERFLTVVRTN